MLHLFKLMLHLFKLMLHLFKLMLHLFKLMLQIDAYFTPTLALKVDGATGVRYD
jgi:hypothetical protein